MTHRDKAQTAKASNEDEEEPQQERTSSPLDGVCRADYLRKGGRSDMVRICDKGNYGRLRSLIPLLRLVKWFNSLITTGQVA